MRLALAQLNPTIGDFEGNCQKVLHALHTAKDQGADLVLFSEMVLTGYPPEDFLLQHRFIEEAKKSLERILPQTKGIACVIGTVRSSPLRNSAAVIENGKLLGFQDKTLLPTYDVFDEQRYFEPSSEPAKVWELCGKRVAITICEDIWEHAALPGVRRYGKDPIQELKPLKPDLLLNLSASPFHTGKRSIRIHVCQKAAQTVQCPVAFCNQVGGNDSLIFDGYSMAVDAQGRLCHLSLGFKECCNLIDLTSLHPVEPPEDALEDLYNALVLGLRDYFQKSGFKKACLGVSGGIDSALTACIAKDALGSENVLGVALPSRYSSKESLEDAAELVHNLKIRFQVIPIEEPFKSYLSLLSPYFEGKSPDITEENLQARIRSMLLMALSNKHGYIVLSTGNKSELAMGYSTLYGDMSGGLGVISDLTKEQVYALSLWINRDQMLIPERTLTKPPSAELKENQKDSDTLPPYGVLDAVLKDYIERGMAPDEIATKQGIPLALVNDLVRRIHVNEYKRRQAPPGLRISEKAFSIGRRFPIVQKWI